MLSIGFAIAFTGLLAGPATPACPAGVASTVFPDLDRPGAASSLTDLQTATDPGRWGIRENVTRVFDQDLRRAVLHVRLPKGSINPRHPTAPLGGMGWRWRTPALPANPAWVCLSYHLKFAPDFRFARGGKLPGLFAGNAPSGGRHTTGSQGFSLRLMWRRRGQGEVYAYVPGHPPGRGLSIARGAWRFPRGRWIEIQQWVRPNTPGRNDGALWIWIDRKQVLVRRAMTFRTAPGVHIAGIMADIFFGGKSAPWAAPHDTWIRISPFHMTWR